MTFRGHFKNGQVVLEEPATVPDGTPVTVDVYERNEHQQPKATQNQSIWDALLEVAGKTEGLPADFADEHDHYIHGTPKRNKQ